MAKVKIKANKLENASVNFISLVQRGANRIPFRIIKLDKQESDMLDLSRVLRRKAEEPKPDDKKPEATPEPTPAPVVVTKTPALLGIVVEKASAEAATKVLPEHGLSVAKAEEVEEGTVVFKQAEGDLDGAAIFRLNDSALALVADLEDDKVPEVVREVVAKTGFFPPMAMVEGMVQKSDENKADFDSYAALIESLIPANVRKAADVLHTTLHPVREPTRKDDAPPPEAKKDEPAVPTPGLTVEQAQEIVQKSVNDALKSIQDLLSQVTKSVEGLTSQVSDIKEQGSTLATKMAEVEKVAKAADESVKSIVVGSAPAGDPDGHTATRVKKQGEADPRTGVFDTAYLPRRNRRI